MQYFLYMVQYLLANNSIDIIAGDFNCDLLKVSENKFRDIFTDQMVNKPTLISRCLIDHVQVRKTLMAEFSINATVGNIYFSGRDTAS